MDKLSTLKRAALSRLFGGGSALCSFAGGFTGCHGAIMPQILRMSTEIVVLSKWPRDQINGKTLRVYLGPTWGGKNPPNWLGTMIVRERPYTGAEPEKAGAPKKQIIEIEFNLRDSPPADLLRIQMTQAMLGTLEEVQEGVETIFRCRCSPADCAALIQPLQQ